MLNVILCIFQNFNQTYIRMLKSIKVIIITALITQTAVAQDETSKQTLLSGKIQKIGIIASLSGQYVSLTGGFRPATGGSLSLLFNEKFSIGLGGYHVQNPNAVVGDLTTRGSVGGLQLQYITKPSKLVHVAFPLLIGVGYASSDTLTSRGERGNKGKRGKNDWGGWDVSKSSSNNATFGVIQPGINVEVNVLKYLSIYAGANYRIALNSSSTILPNNKLSGLGLEVGVKGGLFGFPLSRFKKK